MWSIARVEIVTRCEPFRYPTVICIPVRDEAQRLVALFDRLLTIQDHSNNLLVAFTFDGCTDSGWDLVQPLLNNTEIYAQKIYRSDTPNAGRARREAMRFGQALLLKRLAHEPLNLSVMLSTDADTIPSRDWVHAARMNLSHVDVVAGYTRLDETSSCPRRLKLEAYLERLHAIKRTVDPIDYDPVPSHPFVGGANLGMRLSTYNELGGIRPIPTGEDRDFVHRARVAGYRVRHARDMRVITSSRLVGRTQAGLAEALAETETQEVNVEHPLDAIEHYRLQAQLRGIFDGSHSSPQSLAKIAKQLKMPIEEIETELANAPSADAFVTKISDGKANARTVSLATASTMLDAVENATRQAA